MLSDWRRMSLTTSRISIAGHALLIIAAALLATGCASRLTPEQPDAPQNTMPQSQVQDPLEPRYSIDLDIKIEGRDLTVTGVTDIPDGSHVNLGIHRHIDYFSLNEDIRLGNRTVELVGEKLVEVRDGQFVFASQISDSGWYQDEVQRNKEMGAQFREIPELAYVLTKFVPEVAQPDDPEKQTEAVVPIIAEKAFRFPFTEAP